MIAREIDAEDIGTVTARELPDVVLVGLGESSDHALELIDKIVGAAACPVIVPCTRRSRVHKGSKRDLFAHISDDDVEDRQRCCASAQATTIASSSSTPPPSSTATDCFPSDPDTSAER